MKEKRKKILTIFLAATLMITGINVPSMKLSAEPIDETPLVKSDTGEDIYTAMLDVKVQDNRESAGDGATKFNLRFVGSVNSLEYKKAGFVFSLTNQTPEKGAEGCVFRETEVVYKKLYAGDKLQSVEDLYGGCSQYMYGFTMLNVPAKKVIYVRGYVELNDGGIIYGNVRTVTAPGGFEVQEDTDTKYGDFY